MITIHLAECKAKKETPHHDLDRSQHAYRPIEHWKPTYTMQYIKPI